VNEPKYVFDTNIFIYMQRRFPEDIHESLWRIIEETIDSGIVISSEEVLDEIAKGNDSLIEWAQARKDSFVESYEDIQNIVRDILQKNDKFVLGSKKTNGADPFVIACAIVKSCKVVTEEFKSGSNNPPKIPNICEQYGVKYINFNDFCREMEIKI
jgi:predicted nucleic acid-binding protein